MNKKMKILKKAIKRNMKDIEYKKSCSKLKKKFLIEQKTVIFNNGGFHPLWVAYSQPMVGEISENGYLEEATESFLPLDVNKAIERILEAKKYSKVVVSCYNYKTNQMSWFTI